MGTCSAEAYAAHVADVVLLNTSCKLDTSECSVAGQGGLSQRINKWLPSPSKLQLSSPVVSLPWLRREFGPLFSSETACGL